MRTRFASGPGAHQGGRPSPRASPIGAIALMLAAPVLAVAFGLLAHRADAQAATTSGGTVQVVQTDWASSQFLARQPDLTLTSGAPPAGTPVISLNDQVRYQRVNGFGAAMTDTSAWLLRDELSPQSRAAVMNELFGAGGIRLNFLRLPIGASDFTHNGVPYSYDDLPRGRKDPKLLHFSIAHDEAYIIPALQQALAINPAIQILANPWSPPGWMKTNNSLDNHHNQGVLRRSDYRVLARYFVKFLQSYLRLGIRIDAITPQNEPTNPTRYPGLDLDSNGEARFISRYLHPALRRAGLHVRIFGGDVGFDTQTRPYTVKIAGDPLEMQSGRDYVKTLARSRASRLLAGIAWHCYFGSPRVMSGLHGINPRLGQIIDECSPGITKFPITELVIAGLRNWAGVVALWNLALDPHGGPVQPPNNGCPRCTGVVTVNEQSQSVTLTKNFYELGQASAFVQPGAVRVKTNHFVSYVYTGRGRNIVTPGLDDVALVNPDGSRVLIAYNNSTQPITFAVSWRGQYFSYSLSPGTTATFVWNRPG